MITVEGEQIFNQIKIYQNEVEKFELKLKNNDFAGGDREYIIKSINKNKILIDVLLDKYNKQKNLCACP